MSAKAFKPLPTGVARAAVGHMPFPGHRTQGEVRAKEFKARKARQKQDVRKAKKEAREAKDELVQRSEEAQKGSAALKEAMFRMVA